MIKRLFLSSVSVQFGNLSGFFVGDPLTKK